MHIILVSLLPPANPTFARQGQKTTKQVYDWMFGRLSVKIVWQSENQGGN